MVWGKEWNTVQKKHHHHGKTTTKSPFTTMKGSVNVHGRKRSKKLIEKLQRESRMFLLGVLEVTWESYQRVGFKKNIWTWWFPKGEAWRGFGFLFGISKNWHSFWCVCFFVRFQSPPTAKLLEFIVIPQVWPFFTSQCGWKDWEGAVVSLDALRVGSKRPFFGRLKNFQLSKNMAGKSYIPGNQPMYVGSTLHP